MITSRSAYLMTDDWFVGGGDIADKAIIELRIWKGDYFTPPTDANYKLEVINPLLSTGNFQVDLSEFVEEFVNENLITYDDNTDVYLDNNIGLSWVQYKILRYVNNVEFVGEDITELAIRGYTYSEEESFDFQTTKLPFVTIDSTDVSKNSLFVLPIQVDRYTSFDLSVVSLPNNTINYTNTINGTLESSEQIQRLVITNLLECYNAGDKEIEISIDNNLVHSVSIRDEKKHNPFDLFFINRFGQMEGLTFFREKTEKIKVKTETYERSNGLPINGVHRFVNYNTNGRSSFKANTGYLTEDKNEKIKQLLLSDRHWIFKNNKFMPVNITTTSQEFKTRQKDRLINYEFEFEYSYNDLNRL